MVRACICLFKIIPCHALFVFTADETLLHARAAWEESTRVHHGQLVELEGVLEQTYKHGWILCSYIPRLRLGALSHAQSQLADVLSYAGPGAKAKVRYRCCSQ